MGKIKNRSNMSTNLADFDARVLDAAERIIEQKAARPVAQPFVDSKDIQGAVWPGSEYDKADYYLLQSIQRLRAAGRLVNAGGRRGRYTLPEYA